MLAPYYMKTLHGKKWKKKRNEGKYKPDPEIRTSLFIINDSDVEDEYFAMGNTIFDRSCRVSILGLMRDIRPER